MSKDRVEKVALSVQKSAETAKTFGVTLDELIGITTGVGEATRESGAVLGGQKCLAA